MAKPTDAEFLRSAQAVLFAALAQIRAGDPDAAERSLEVLMDLIEAQLGRKIL